MIETMLKEVDWSLVELCPLKESERISWEKAHREWFVTCPLSIWAKDAPKDKQHWFTYAEFRGMTLADRNCVTHTADGLTWYDDYDPILRKRMRDRISKAKARKNKPQQLPLPLSQDPMDIFFAHTDWRKVDISHPNSLTCPLRVFAFAGHQNWYFQTVAQFAQYGVNREDASPVIQRIWTAADGFGNPQLRKRIIRAIANARRKDS